MSTKSRKSTRISSNGFIACCWCNGGTPIDTGYPVLIYGYTTKIDAFCVVYIPKARGKGCLRRRGVRRLWCRVSGHTVCFDFSGVFWFDFCKSCLRHFIVWLWRAGWFFNLAWVIGFDFRIALMGNCRCFWEWGGLIFWGTQSFSHPPVCAVTTAVGRFLFGRYKPFPCLFLFLSFALQAFHTLLLLFFLHFPFLFLFFYPRLSRLYFFVVLIFLDTVSYSVISCASGFATSDWLSVFSIPFFPFVTALFWVFHFFCSRGVFAFFSCVVSALVCIIFLFAHHWYKQDSTPFPHKNTHTPHTHIHSLYLSHKSLVLNSLH